MFESERRFLVNAEPILETGKGNLEVSEIHYISQGYICESNGNLARIRKTQIFDHESSNIINKNKLCIKGKRVNGANVEIEKDVDPEEAAVLMTLAGIKVIHKKRHIIPLPDGFKIELDFFKEPLDGLIIAEIESVNGVDYTGELPQWFGLEITDDNRYSNYSLMMNGVPDKIIPVIGDLNVFRQFIENMKDDVFGMVVFLLTALVLIGISTAMLWS